MPGIERQNLLGKHQSSRQAKRARRRALQRIVAKRKALKTSTRGAAGQGEAVHHSRCKSCTDVQHKETQVGTSNDEYNRQVCNPAEIRKTNKKGNGELAEGWISSFNEVGKRDARGSKASGKQDALEHARLVSLPAISSCAIL